MSQDGFVVEGQEKGSKGNGQDGEAAARKVGEQVWAARNGDGSFNLMLQPEMAQVFVQMMQLVNTPESRAVMAAMRGEQQAETWGSKVSGAMNGALTMKKVIVIAVSTALVVYALRLLAKKMQWHIPLIYSPQKVDGLDYSGGAVVQH